MTYLDNGRYASPADEMTALALEAKRHDLSYGQLVANTAGRDRPGILPGEIPLSEETQRTKIVSA